MVCICDVILQHPLFKNIKREQSHKLGEIADIIEIDPKQVLFFNFQAMDRVYFVLRGKVKLHNYDADSTKEYIHRLLNKGQAAGLDLLYTELKHYPYAATAIETSKILTLDATKFKTIIDQDLIMKANLLEYISNLSLGHFDRAKDYVLSNVPERLYKYLEHRALNCGSNEYELGIPKADLANYLGTVSSTLSRAFKELEDSGEVKVSKGHIKVNSLLSPAN